MTGFSSGAIMTYRYACQGAVPIRAIAPVAGTMLLTEACTPKRPTSLLAINGTADGEVPYQGGHLLPGASANNQVVPSAPSVAGLWAQLNGCSTAASSTTTGLVGVSRWSGCADGVTVQLETITGAGHTWYATGFGPADGAIDASTVIGDFFAGIH
jgi:polyhydroxybutyrate depolymerase